jgi:signal transduction histidine kinase
MTLRQKTLLTVGLILVGLLVFLYAASQTLIVRGFEQVENQAVQDNLNRVLNAIADEQAALLSTSNDWSQWDDTYNFVQSPTQAYIDSNLAVGTFNNLKIDLAAFIDLNGKMVFSKAVDRQSGETVDFPAELAPYLGSYSPLINPPVGGQSGLVRIPDGLLMLVAQRITNNDGTAPPRGTLVFGRYLNDEYLGSQAQSLRLTLTLYTPGATDLPEDVQIAAASLTRDNPTLVRPLSEKVAAGYATLEDVAGKTIGLLRVEMPRAVYQQGQASLSYFLLALLGVGAASVLVTLFVLERMVLRRIDRLSRKVIQIRDAGISSTPLPLNGNDELADLARSMQSLLDALAVSQGNLEKANNELERRVVERTRALKEANDRLTQEVAERRQAQNEAAAARDQALQALKFKQQVLANISHDSRTPLNVITLRVEMMQRGVFGPVNDRQKAALDGVLVSANQLLGFINNLLSEAQFQSNRVKLKFAPCPPADLVNHAREIMTPLAAQKHLSLDIEVAADLPPTVTIDADRFNQILSNLMDNAIKFTDEGGVKVRLYRADAEHWALRVSDTGTGIPKDAQPRIFDAFWQVDGSSTRRVNLGVGLGLSIVRQLAEAMGGSISVESEPGAGTTFTVTLPFAQSVEQESSHERPGADRGGQL